MHQDLNKAINPFKEGQRAWDNYYSSKWKLKTSNPYVKNSESWRLWNRGWSTNFKGI